jgi:hypothetical protein
MAAFLEPAAAPLGWTSAAALPLWAEAGAIDELNQPGAAINHGTVTAHR